MTKRLKAYLLLLNTAVIWGVASVVIKYTLYYIQPFAFLFWRFLITALILAPIFIVHVKRNKIVLSLKKVLLLGGLGFLGTTLSLALLFIGYKYTTAIDGILIDSIAPIMTILGGAIFLKEKITKMEKLGAFFAFLGSVLTIAQPVFEGKALASENVYGNFLVFLSTIAWAMYILGVRKLEAKDKVKTDPLTITSISFFSALITIIPFYIWELLTNPVSLPNANLAIPGIIFMSVFSSVIAYFTYNAGFALVDTAEATIFDYIRPIFTAPLAVIFLKEEITFYFLLGAFFIFFGVFLTERQKHR